ncbi:MAG: hypothetical protein GXX79_13150 [Actinomycetales bacterium]|nr:hypothetical protein [Actinomycetales bacterium]
MRSARKVIRLVPASTSRTQVATRVRGSSGSSGSIGSIGSIGSSGSSGSPGSIGSPGSTGSPVTPSVMTPSLLRSTGVPAGSDPRLWTVRRSARLWRNGTGRCGPGRSSLGEVRT